MASIGIDFVNSWTGNSELEINDGGWYYMNPDNGISNEDDNDDNGVLIAQFTVDQNIDMNNLLNNFKNSINLQGLYICDDNKTCWRYTSCSNSNNNIITTCKPELDEDECATVKGLLRLSCMMNK